MATTRIPFMGGLRDFFLVTRQREETQQRATESAEEHGSNAMKRAQWVMPWPKAMVTAVGHGKISYVTAPLRGIGVRDI